MQAWLDDTKVKTPEEAKQAPASLAYYLLKCKLLQRDFDMLTEFDNTGSVTDGGVVHTAV